MQYGMTMVKSPRTEPTRRTATPAQKANGNTTRTSAAQKVRYAMLWSQYAEFHDKEFSLIHRAAHLWQRLHAITQIALTHPRNPTTNWKYALGGNIHTLVMLSIVVFSWSRRTNVASETPPKNPSISTESSKYVLALSSSSILFFITASDCISNLASTVTTCLLEAFSIRPATDFPRRDDFGPRDRGLPRTQSS